MQNESIYYYLYMPINFIFRAIRFIERKTILLQFKSVGEKCILELPLHITGHKNISLGNNVRIGFYSRINTFEKRYGQIFTPKLIIGDNVTMESSCHIGCVNKVTIGNNVMMASHVYITDHNHGYESVEIPYRKQKLIYGENVIGDNTWIGEGAMIMPNVKVGSSCIIAANAVITKDIPSYSIAAGVPAVVIKHFNLETEAWERVDL